MSFIKKTVKEVAALSDTEFLEYQEQKDAFETKRMNNIESAIKEQGLFLTKNKGAINAPIKDNSMIQLNGQDVQEATKSLNTQRNNSAEIGIPVNKLDNSNMVTGQLFAPVQAGVDSMVQPSVTIRQLFRNVPFDTEYYKYVYVSAETKNAEGVLCAAPTSDSEKTFTVATKPTVKIKATAVSCWDFITDVTFSEQEIQLLLNDAVTQKEDSELVLGTDTDVSPASLTSVSTVFDGTDPNYIAKIQAANIVDLITTMGAKIGSVSGGPSRKSFMADTCVLNLEDWHLLATLKKDTDTNYLQYRDTSVGGMYLINGIKIVYSSSVVKNTLFVFDSRQGEIIYQPKGTVLSAHWKDHEADLMGYKFYERLNLLVKPNNTAAFLKCEDITGALSSLTSA